MAAQIPKTSLTVLDTDLHIHGRSADRPVRDAAEKIRQTKRPIASTSFSRLELKGNYIQDLLLLRRKVAASSDMQEAFVRIGNTGGRKAQLMLAQLIRWVGGKDFNIGKWDDAQSTLLTYLDSQVLATWHEFANQIDVLIDELNCTRAQEPPTVNRNGKWEASIPRCRPRNTRCRVVDFLRDHSGILGQLVKAYDRLPDEIRTAELGKIREVARELVDSGRFEWHGSACRSVGDLLTGLQAHGTSEFVSSNYKEHKFLASVIGYNLTVFEFANLRTK